jgi:GNAT superfamily N-acetyltransferase
VWLAVVRSGAVRLLAVPAEMHRQLEATLALIAEQRSVRLTRGACGARGRRRAIPQKPANRFALGFRDATARDSGQARVLAFLPREFLRELHPNPRIPSDAGPGRQNRRVVVERLTDLTPEQLAAPIAESEAQGLGFVRRLADEWVSGANRFDLTGEALFAVRDAADIVAVGGLNVDPYAADARIGRVRHLYVLTPHRRRGLGARLVTEIIAMARGHFHTLRLSTSNPEAARLYERLGFQRRADLARCTHIMDITRPGDGSDEQAAVQPPVEYRERV